MLHQRKLQISLYPWDLDYFKEKLAACAQAGGTNVTLYERAYLQKVDCLVIVANENAGTLEALYRQFLAPVAAEPTARAVHEHSQVYLDGVAAWLRAQQGQ